MLPSKSWDAYEDVIRRLGERRNDWSEDDIRFLAVLGFVTLDAGVQLSEPGDCYFRAKFISSNDDIATKILHECVLQYPPAAAILQFLAGVPTATKTKAETVLRSQGFGDELNERRLGTLLMLMSRAGVISYSPKTANIIVLVQPAQAIAPPSSIFISPQTPFGNRVWLRRVLQECSGFIYWLDKHFMPGALEAIWDVADGSRISEVHIISLELADNSGRKALREYRDLRAELLARSIELEWRLIESREIRDTHDRWIIGSTSARNVPNVNAILSGQHSELSLSHKQAELEMLFKSYWSRAVDVSNRAS